MTKERYCLLLLALISLGLVAGAVYLQVFHDEQPCPLCILQRYALLLVALFALAGMMVRSPKAAKVCTWLAWGCAIIGAGVAGRHVYVQWFPITSCGVDTLEPIVDGLPMARLLPLVFQVGGFCETPYPPILGLSLPQWALVAFAAIAISIPVTITRASARR